jgi:hypothetical protein
MTWAGEGNIMADIIDLKTRIAINRRAERRRRVLKGAVLSFNSGFGAFEAVVRDQSRNGARLAFGDTVGVPPFFELAINGETTKRAAKVRWRSPTLIGVEFV